MKLNIKSKGVGGPKICIIACTHGDEVIGKKVIQELKRLKLKKGTLTFLIANEEAIKKKKRYIDKDLNRAFPGKARGLAEERLAHFIKKEVEKYDIAIDLHATNSRIDNLAIVTKLDQKTKNILKMFPIEKLAIARKRVFGGGELVRYAQVGIALEYGPNKTGKNYKRALGHVKALLRNLGVLSGKKQELKNKVLYTITSRYKTSKDFVQASGLKDFQYIRKGQVIGKENGKDVRSRLGFYPLFLGKGRYKETLALVSQKTRLKL